MTFNKICFSSFSVALQYFWHSLSGYYVLSLLFSKTSIKTTTFTNKTSLIHRGKLLLCNYLDHNYAYSSLWYVHPSMTNPMLISLIKLIYKHSCPLTHHFLVIMTIFDKIVRVLHIWYTHAYKLNILFLYVTFKNLPWPKLVNTFCILKLTEEKLLLNIYTT